MTNSVRIYAGTQEGLFIWRGKNGSWENVAISFATGTIDSIDGLRSQPNVVYLGVTNDGLTVPMMPARVGAVCLKATFAR